MFNKHIKVSPHYDALGVFQDSLSDAETLHAAIKNICILDGFVKSIAIFEGPPVAVIIVDRLSKLQTGLFRKKQSRQSYQITLRLLKLQTKTSMCELTCAIKPIRGGQTDSPRKSANDVRPENWVVAFQSKLADNISRAGGRTFQTVPAAQI